MRYIGSHPGAYSFRLIIIVILVTSFIVLFFDYTKKLAITTEKVSIQQTKNIINSSLAVVFASYAVKGELDRLNELNGGNPFVLMAEYDLVPKNFLGEVELGDIDDLEPGWYFDILSRKVFYKAIYDDQVYYFYLVFEYRDVNGSGRFESVIDEYQRLYFRQLP